MLHHNIRLRQPVQPTLQEAHSVESTLVQASLACGTKPSPEGQVKQRSAAAWPLGAGPRDLRIA